MRCTTGLLIGLVAMCCGPAFGRDADESRLMPRKDQQINALLVKIKRGQESNEVQAKLRKIERQRLCRGLAYGLMRYETRYGALRFINAEGPFRELTPYVVLALKWGSSQQRLVALDIVLKTRAKAAIPVLLSHVLDDDYLVYETVGGERGPGGHFRPGRSVASVGLFRKTSRTLHILSDGKIGSPSLAARARSIKSEPMKRKWRAWWKQNAAEHFPDIKTEVVVFQNEQQVRKWCKEMTRIWGAQLAAEAEREFAELWKKVPPRVAHGKTRRHLDTVSRVVPRSLAGPVHTAVLLRKVLDTSADAGKPNAGAAKTHCAALVCLFRSRDFAEVTSFLAWGIANDKVKNHLAAALTLGRMRGAQTVNLLAGMAAENPPPAVLEEVAASLRELGESGVAEVAGALGGLLSTKAPPPRFLSSVSRGLRNTGRLGPVHAKAVVKAVAPHLEDSREEVVMAGLEVLGEIGRENALKLLQDALPKLGEKTKLRAREMIKLIELRLKGKP